ncbi:MAG: DUF2188 domain-containing protein [Tahibacter sp.]
MERVVYHLVHKDADDRWHLTKSGNVESAVYGDKDDGVMEAKLLCRAHVAHGDKAQLVVHDLDGSVESEFNYGDDRPRTDS